MSKFILTYLSLTLVATLNVSVHANDNFNGFKNPIYGYEVGLERQLEIVDDSKFVNRLMTRYQGTVDWNLYSHPNGHEINTLSKAGLMIGRYKGSAFGTDDEYGSLILTRGGFTGEILTQYTYNTNKLDPFAGLSADLEINNEKRIEWQSDILLGVTYNISDKHDLSVRYQHPVIHKLTYTSDSTTYNQDDGYAVAVIGKQYDDNGHTHTIKLEYEHFNESPKIKSGNTISYEPEISNILLSYKRTY